MLPYYDEDSSRTSKVFPGYVSDKFNLLPQYVKQEIGQVKFYALCSDHFRATCFHRVNKKRQDCSKCSKCMLNPSNMQKIINAVTNYQEIILDSFEITENGILLIDIPEILQYVNNQEFDEDFN